MKKVLTLASLAFVLGFTINANSQTVDCSPQAVASVHAHGVPNATLDWVDTQYNGSNSIQVIGYKFWFTTPQCPRGYVVVDTNELCKVTQEYTQGCGGGYKSAR